MAEEAEVAEQVQEQPANQMPAQGLTPEGAQVAQILAMAQKNPEFAKQPEVAAIVAKFGEFKGAQPHAAQPAKPNGQADDEVEEAPKSIFFSKKKDAEIEIKSLEDFEKAAKKLGFENAGDFWKAVPKLREKAQQAEEFEKKATGLEDLIANTPPDLYESIQMWVDGKDYREPFKNADLDFSKPFDKQMEKVVNHYFPNKYTSEDLETPDNTIQAVIDIAKEKFLIGKEKVEERRAAIDTRATQRAEAVKASVNSSVKALEDSFPDMSTKEKSQVRSAMLAGDVNPIFFNKDGSYKTDAAKRIALALFGEKEIEAQVKGAVKKTNTQKTINAVNGKKDKPSSGNASDVKVQLPTNIADQLSGWNPSSVYDSRPPAQK